MGCHKGLIKLAVRNRLNDTFVRIIQDIPAAELKTQNNALLVKQNGNLMTYDQFYSMLYLRVLEYIPGEKENPLFKVIKMLPKTIENIYRIKQNNEIINFQKTILDEYFYTPGDKNIKEKLSELENAIDQLIDNGELETLDDVLSRFDERMRSGLLADLERLSQLLNQRG